MHFPRIFIIFLSASMLSLTFAGPIPRPLGDSTELAARDEESALERRVLTAQQARRHAAQAVRAQAARKQNKAVKKTQPRVTKAARTAAHQAKVKTPAQKQAKKAAQTTRRQARLPGSKGPATTPPKARLNAAEKAQVKANMRSAGTAYHNRLVGQRATQTVRAQAARKQNKAIKKTQPRVTKAARAAAHQAKAKTPAQKQTRKAAQTARRQARPAGTKGLARTPPMPRFNPVKKAQVKAQMRNTGTAYRALANKPEKTDTFSNGPVTRTGKDARVAIFNSLLHSNAPVGAGPGGRSGMPAHFRNTPVGGVPPLPGAPSGRNNGLTEYPVKSGTPAGYQGPGDRGKVRAIIGNGRFEGLVNHPGGGGAPSNLHQGMTQTHATPAAPPAINPNIFN